MDEEEAEEQAVAEPVGREPVAKRAKEGEGELETDARLFIDIYIAY